ncbi:enoyl-CoA hydratase [bacterium M00.F.Ca.ET.228.01.1.1]|uniref:enoyl-CoA hydratase-related protein n=1 Tax=Paraburkholderia phenoliruptrix TaxID=252970 RepID=UPI001092C2BF|nr:enoyl-CoA hydratase-related protein [Paraburkholderia phenoliruptrix]TGP39516.1 enoyl-CoA hydratase [bacterium M00.F.Ca.ET.228.01.1.1]TGR95250.1 enoyl-CoA hydratase [bacterium M00.F.Ca.ET.191.01.1.1]TGT96096.1 enoyl-CoA hydratase [bacterium M00.F.Ca.ET.155.01.1.1]MBW0448265.1 enoyl-CoA hydratase/isomerase family protein [Paraburkholderia phenoliruptrix]MBW9099476.1 enoyl-CoA hydratase/isomerase family protein [Paraburkholderia phenoliruptrix]
MSLKLDKHDGVAIVTLDRPPVNALTIALYAEIADLFEQLGKELDVHCAVLTGAGERAFCAGLDLNEFLAAKPEDDPERAAIVRRTFSAVYRCAIPVIAAINGPALGAGSVLATVCDIRIAASHARFGTPEINVGRCGGAAHHGRLIPQGALRRMYFTGEPISAQEAFRLGLVDQVVASEELMPTALELASKIAAKSPLGLRYAKHALNDIESMALEAGYEHEQSYSTRLMYTEDAREATRASVEKRPPVFRGR